MGMYTFEKVEGNFVEVFDSIDLERHDASFFHEFTQVTDDTDVVAFFEFRALSVEKLVRIVFILLEPMSHIDFPGPIIKDQFKV